MKCTVLPQFLFLFPTLPIELKPTTLRKWQSIINAFIWKMQRPKIGFHHLNKPASLGDFGLPDLKFYYVTGQLRPLYSFLKTTHFTVWMQIEVSFVKPLFLTDVI